MRRSNFALRMPPVLMVQAKKAAESQGVALNQLINMAVAQVVSTLDAAEYFRARAKQGDPQKALSILERVGVGHPPIPGDELPASRDRHRKRRSKRKPSKEKKNRSRRKISA
jgi:hypothetical protein